MNSDLTSGDLQFDRVEQGSADPGAASGTGVVCSNCSAKIESAYYNVGNDPVCARCKNAIQAHIVPDKSWGALTRALVLGVVAAIAGAIVYYGVIAITNFEIGIVAILIGFMVGWAVRRGAGGRGGRRFQLIAVALTYFSVGLAYTPLAIKSALDEDKSSALQTDSAGVTAPTSSEPASGPVAVSDPSAAASATGESNSTRAKPGFPLLLVMIIGFTLALPVLVIAGSMPSGLISALIIFIGIRQAWQMTAVPHISITGPFRVGPRVPSSSS
jgi:hypothetical protein